MVLSLLVFAFVPEATAASLIKSLAFGIAISIAVPAVYPDVRGIHKGDNIMVDTSAIPFFAGKLGTALTGGRKNKEIRVRFDNGEEAVGVVESYGGLLSPPKVKIVYEERLVE